MGLDAPAARATAVVVHGDNALGSSEKDIETGQKVLLAPKPGLWKGTLMASPLSLPIHLAQLGLKLEETKLSSRSLPVRPTVRSSWPLETCE